MKESGKRQMKVKFSNTTYEQYELLSEELRKGQYIPGSFKELSINCLKSIPTFIAYLYVVQVFLTRFLFKTYLFVKTHSALHETLLHDFCSMIITMAIYGAFFVLLAKVFTHCNETFISHQHPIQDQEHRNRLLYNRCKELNASFELQHELQKLTMEELLFTDIYKDGQNIQIYMKETMFIEKKTYKVSNIEKFVKEDTLDFICLDEEIREIEMDYKKNNLKGV